MITSAVSAAATPPEGERLPTPSDGSPQALSKEAPAPGHSQQDEEDGAGLGSGGVACRNWGSDAELIVDEPVVDSDRRRKWVVLLEAVRDPQIWSIDAGAPKALLTAMGGKDAGRLYCSDRVAVRISVSASDIAVALEGVLGRWRCAVAGLALDDWDVVRAEVRFKVTDSGTVSLLLRDDMGRPTVCGASATAACAALATLGS